MTATTAIIASYALGLIALAVDGWRARSMLQVARERLLEETDTR